jgi:molybdopterin converting factor small subunit
MSEVEVRLAALLHAYTQGTSVVHASGATIGEVLDDLDRRYRGIRFRLVDEQDSLRPHMRLFLNGADARDVACPVKDGDEIYIVGALSGG